jgi:hypothetical protein
MALQVINSSGGKHESIQADANGLQVAILNDRSPPCPPSFEKWWLTLALSTGAGCKSGIHNISIFILGFLGRSA